MNSLAVDFKNNKNNYIITKSHYKEGNVGKGKVTKQLKDDREPHLEDMASLGSFDGNTFLKTLYGDDGGYAEDYDVDGQYQGFGEDIKESDWYFNSGGSYE